MIGTGFKLPLPDCNYESYEAICLDNSRVFQKPSLRYLNLPSKLNRLQSNTPEAYHSSFTSHSLKENSIISLTSHTTKLKPNRSSAVRHTLKKLDYKCYFINKRPLDNTLRQEALRINTRDVNRPNSRPKSAISRTAIETKELVSLEDEYLRKQTGLNHNITFKPLSNASKFKTMKFIENNGSKAIELLKKREIMRKKTYGEQPSILTRPPRSSSNNSRLIYLRRAIQTPDLKSDILTVTRCPTSNRSKSLTNSRRTERVISTSETQTNLSVEDLVSSSSKSPNFSISEGGSQEEDSPTLNLRRCYF